MDNEDKVERQSAGKKKKGKRKKEKENKIHKRQGYVSAEIWWIASTPPHPPNTTSTKDAQFSISLRTDSVFCILNETRPVGDLFSVQNTHFFFFLFSWTWRCWVAVANTTRSEWDLEGWKKYVQSRSAPLPSCVGFHEGRRCTGVIVIQI